MTSDFNFEKTNRFYGVKLACLQNMTEIASQEVIELDTLKPLLADPVWYFFISAIKVSLCSESFERVSQGEEACHRNLYNSEVELLLFLPVSQIFLAVELFVF